MDIGEIYRPGLDRRCWNGENETTQRGSGGMSNRGAKGHAFISLPAGRSAVLLDARGAGAVDHIWITFKTARRPLDPPLLRALRLEMFWDGASRPAVSVPLGDFFGVMPGVTSEFENALFSFPRQAALNTYVTMPFRESARITLSNDSGTDVTHLFHTVEYVLDPAAARADPLMYFHAGWRRETPNAAGADFTILPHIPGRGRFLGCHLGVQADPVYGGAWWGEGEVRMWMDGDREYPTWIGTGAEDYLGTGWGLGEFRHRYQGCLLADVRTGRYAGYRYHLPDPVVFHEGCRVAIQTIGGAYRKDLPAAGADRQPLVVVSIDQGGRLVRNLEQSVPWRPDDPRIGPDDWCNFYRQDDWCATAFFYSEYPENPLLPLADAAARAV